MIVSEIDYQWLPERQVTALETQEKTRPQASPLCGFAVDASGDWLLLSSGFGELDQDESVLCRSGDQGAHWSRVSSIPQVDTHEGYGYRCNSLLVTDTGRILTGCVRRPATYSLIPHLRQKNRNQILTVGDHPPGRSVLAKPGFFHSNQSIYVAYSDDGGESWMTTDLIDTSPLHSPYVDCCGSMVQAPDGDILLPFAAWLEEGIAYGWNMCGCYVASSDHGETWGKSVVVATGEDDRGQWYNETAVLPREDQPWIAMVRMNPKFRIGKPSGHGMLGGYRCFSHDQGRTWTAPEPVSHTVAYPVLKELIDGSILFAASHWAASYMFLSCDNGRSWSYGNQVPLSGGDTHHWIQPDADSVVVAHKDITHQKVLLTWFAKQPITKGILMSPWRCPQHRWTMRELKTIFADQNLKPCSTSVRLGNGTILVAGVTGETEEQLFSISSTDAGEGWTAPEPICRPTRYKSIRPGCMTAGDDGTVMIICTESEQPDRFDSPSLLRTFISHDHGIIWHEAAATEEIDGIRFLRPGSGIIKDDAGHLVLPLSGADDDGRSVCGLVRCQGPTGLWGSFHPIAESAGAADILDQPALLPLNDGRWLGLFRANLAEYRKEYVDTFGKTFRQPPLWETASRDQGKTWTQTAHTWSAHHPHLLQLPDGGVMLTSIVASTLRYQVSYNDGDSWSFENCVISYPDRHLYGGIYNMSDLSVVVIDDRTLLGTYFCDDQHEGGPRIVAIWIRALPAASPEARERGL